MQVEIFCLCQKVTLNSLNQPTLFDVFDVKVAPSEPSLVESFLVVMSLRIFREDEGQHRFSVACKDATGKILLGPITEIMSFSRLPTDSTTAFHTYKVPLGQLKFGKYVFSLTVERGSSAGKEIVSTVLYLLPETQWPLA